MGKLCVTQPPKEMADATLSQANPTTATPYTVLDTTRNVRIQSVYIVVTWTVQPSPLDLIITIDGITITHTVANPVTNTKYLAFKDPTIGPTLQQLLPADMSTYFQQKAFLYEGRSVKIEAKTTGGTVSNLSAMVKYSKY